MYAFKNKRSNITFEISFGWIDKFDILRTNDNVNWFVISKSSVDTWHLYTKDFFKFVFNHGAVNDVTVTDEVSDESVFRFVVNVFRSADLLDVSLVHDHNGIGHGKCFFLIVCNINESNAEFFFQTNQLILHALAKF